MSSSMADERKERVLHARIPAGLEEQIKRLAEGLRVPVSNLVRNMLEDAIDVTRRVATPKAADIYGWQALVMNVAVPCVRCGKELEAGERAFVGLSSDPRDAKHFICSVCLPRTSKGATDGSQD
jgi:hypothetical protein